MPREPRWSAAVEGRIASAATEAARAIAGRLDAMRVEPYSLARGNAGFALLYGHLDECFPNEGWDARAHRHLESAWHAADSRAMRSPGLHSGLSGLAFAASRLSRGGSRYRKFLRGVDDRLIPLVRASCDELSKETRGVDVSTFDVVSGLAGAGAYLLCRRDEPRAMEALRTVMGRLAELMLGDEASPRWRTPARFLRGEPWPREHRRGNLNCGLAHGIPGPLALLSLADHEGVSVPKAREAIGAAADWLLRNRSDDELGANWPEAAPAASSARRGTRRDPGAPAAWCYGAPGVARSLWLAGRALGHDGYREAAVSAMEAVHRRPPAKRALRSTNVCHGTAGLLQITLRFARDASRPAFGRAARELTAELASAAGRGGAPGDGFGLRQGDCGVALALLAASRRVEPGWDRAFLLS